MSLEQPQNFERHLWHRARVHDVDAVAIRAALAGTPVALDAIEQGATITVCDIYQLDQAIVAAGLGVDKRTLQRWIQARREEIVSPGHLAALTESSRENADALIDAVEAGDGLAVAAVLGNCELAQMTMLTLVLAARAAASRAGAGQVPDAE